MTNYLIPISETVATAWQKVHGIKGSVWAALFIVFLIALALMLIDFVLLHFAPNIEPLFSMFAQLVNFLLQVGVLYIGIQRAYDLPVSFTMMFRAFEFPVGWRLVVLYLLQILILLPFIFMLILPIALSSYYSGSPNADMARIAFIVFAVLACFFILYLTVRMILSVGFVLDRVAGPVEAIKYSFQATRDNFWRIFVIIMIQIFFFTLAILLLLIGLIWAIPFGVVLYGVMYRALSVNVTPITTTNVTKA